MIPDAGATWSGYAGSPALVGREREMALLRGAFERALNGHGSLVLVGGEAGIGKTALVQAFVTEAGKQGALVLSGGCYDLTATPPYGPWLEIADRYPKTPDLPTMPQVLKRGTGIGDLTSQLELFETARDFLISVATARPLVIVLEDLHWSDPASLDLLRYLARQLDGHRLLLVATYRDDEVTRSHSLFQLLPLLIREADAERIELRPLAAVDVRALIKKRYPLSASAVSRLVDYLQDRAAGNPLYLRELLRTLEDEALLYPAEGGWSLGELSDVPVPRLVRQVIQVRMDRFGEETRRLLQIAAVIGQDVSLDLWQAVSGGTDEALIPVIERAVDAQVLTDAPEQTGLRFTHALVREALYEGLVMPRRRALHGRVAEALLASTRVDPDNVAYHLQQAGDERAAEWLIRAGVRARQSAAWFTAADRFLAAATLLEGDEQQARIRGWILFYAGFVLRFSGNPRTFEFLDEAERLAGAAGDPVLAAYVRYHRGAQRCFRTFVTPQGVVRGDMRRGLKELEQGISELDQLLPSFSRPSTDEQAHAIIESWLAGADATISGPALVHDGASDAPPLVTQQLGVLVAWLGHAGYYRRTLAEGEPFLAKVIAIHGDDHLRMNQSNEGHLGLGHAYAAMGRPDDARREFALLRRGYADSGTYAQLDYAIWSDLLMALVPYQTERVAERVRLASEAQRVWKLASGVAIAGPADRAPSQLLLDVLEGRWSEAATFARESRRAVVAYIVDGGFVMLAVLALHRGEPDQAWGYLRDLLPDGAATEPGGHYFPLAITAQAIGAQLALAAGDYEAASGWVEAQERWLDWSGAVLWRADNQLLWGRYQRALGDPGAAFNRAKQAAMLASNPRQPLALIAIDRFLGELATEQDDYSAAETHLTASLDLARACGTPFEEAQSLLALAELLVERGNNQDAGALLNEARAICRTLEARPALARIEQVASQLRHSPAGPRAGLTPREIEVLQLVVQGKTDREIAEELFISHHTAMRHVSNILGKLDVDSRTAAAAYAVRHDLV
jgi:DNA-binding CsgD family transcriptional regulator